MGGAKKQTLHKGNFRPVQKSKAGILACGCGMCRTGCIRCTIGRVCHQDKGREMGMKNYSGKKHCPVLLRSPRKPLWDLVRDWEKRKKAGDSCRGSERDVRLGGKCISKRGRSGKSRKGKSLRRSKQLFSMSVEKRPLPK